MKHSDPFWKPTLILTACLLILISFTSQAQSSPANSITVSGSATVSAVPDRASLSFTIEQRGNKLSSLKTQVDQASRRLIDDLLDHDIAEKNIRSFQLHVYPRYENSDNGKQRQSGFVVMRSIDVTLPSLDDYDQIIDLALAQGVTRVGQIQFEVSDQDALYQQALQKAYQTALEKAQFLAATAQLEIGATLRIDEQSMSQPVTFQMSEMSSRSKSPSLPGEQSIDARLQVQFELLSKD